MVGVHRDRVCSVGRRRRRSSNTWVSDTSTGGALPLESHRYGACQMTLAFVDEC